MKFYFHFTRTNL